jgi:class 3 adenylate cyclase
MLATTKSGRSTLSLALGVEVPADPIEAPLELGEKLVTILFADVRGYTEMTSARPPAEMVGVISAFQR